MSTTSTSPRATAIGCGALLVWASSLAVNKGVSEALGPFTTAALQYAISGSLGALIFFYNGMFSNLDFLKNREFALRSLLFIIYAVLLYSALGLVDRSQMPLVTLLNYTWPTCTMLFSVLLFSQPFRKSLFGIGSIIVISGLTLELASDALSDISLKSVTTKNVAACLCATGAGVSWGLYSACCRRWGVRAGETKAIPIIMGITSVILFILRFAIGEQSVLPTGTLLPLVYLALMPLIGNFCWDIGVRKGNIMLLSLLADGMPWFSLTATHLYLGVEIGANSILSAVLIVAGALVLRRSLAVPN